MRAKLIYSDLLYTASLAVFDEVKKNYQSAEKHIILVPDKYTLICEKLLLERLGVDCSFNAEVMSINRFCSKVVKIDEKLDKQGGVILMQNILYKLNDQLQAFSNMYKQIGFAEDIYATCMQIKASGISADLITENDANEVLLKRKLADLKLIYSTYEQLVEGGLTDGLKKIEQLNAEIKNNAIFEDVAFYFAFFDFFTRQEYKIIENLILNNNFVCVGASYGLGKLNEHIYTNEVYANIQSIFFKYNLKNIVEAREVLPLNFEKLKNELFAFNPTVSTLKTGVIALYSAKNEDEEIEFIAKKIKSLVASKGIKYNQINLALGSIQKYKIAVENIFTAYNIPYFLDDATLLDCTELGRFLTAIIKGVSYGFMEEDLKSIIFNYYFGLKVENNEEIYKFINLLSPNGIKWLTRKYDNISESVQATLPQIEQKINFIYTRLSGLKYGKDYINAIRDIFTYFDVQRLTDELMSNFANDLTAYKTLAQVVPKINQLLNQIEQLSSQTEFDLLSFSKLVLNGLNVSKINLVPLSVDSVFVGDVSASSFDRKDVCFLAGMNLSIAPKISYDLGLVTDKDIDNLSDKYIIEPKISLINMRNRQKLFEVACLAKQKLIVSYLVADNSGATLKPGTLVTSLTKMFAVQDEQGVLNPLKPIMAYSDMLLIQMAGDLLESLKTTQNNRLKCGYSYKNAIADDGTTTVLNLNANTQNELVGEAVNDYANVQLSNGADLNAGQSATCVKNIYPHSKPLNDDSEHERFGYKKLMHFTENLATADNAIKFALENPTNGLAREVVTCCGLKDYLNSILSKKLDSEIKENLNNADLLFFPNGRTSATQLTDYFKCPYMHFLRFGLRLREDLPFKLKKLDIGQILHRICELFANELKLTAHFSGEELVKVEERILNIVASEFSLIFENDDNRFIVKNLKKEGVKLMNSLNNFAKNSNMKIYQTEYSFDAMDIPNAVKKVKLTGKIDRVDKCDNSVLVLDYKTGDSSLDFKKIYYGLKIQLLLYALAILQSGNYSLTGFGYYPINDKYIKADASTSVGQDYRIKGYLDSELETLELLDKTLKDNEEDKKESKLFDFYIKAQKNGKIKASSNLVGQENLLKMVAYVKQLISNAVTSILNGYIAVSPYKDGERTVCEYCIYKGICKKNEKTAVRTIKTKKIEALVGNSGEEQD